MFHVGSSLFLSFCCLKFAGFESKLEKKMVLSFNGSSLMIFIFLFVWTSMAAEGSSGTLRNYVDSIGFDEGSDRPKFAFAGDSSIDGGALQLTPDTENQAFSLKNKSGRIMYINPIRLWSSDVDVNGDDVIASFNTFFAINIYRNPSWSAGEGFAFLIAPDSDSIPTESFGQWLGLTNSTTDGEASNQIVAVEFDTEKQEFDIDDNHIGLNINSIRSNKSVSLTGMGIEISPAEATNYSVWVQYDGKSKVMEVYMAKYKDPKPANPILVETINLKTIVKQESYFGFAGSTGDPSIQLNCVLEWRLEVEDLPVKKDWKRLKIAAGVGVPALIAVILMGVFLGIEYRKRRKKKKDEESEVVGTLKRLPGMPREFKFKELKKATRNFHESLELGRGGFGVVYKGILPEKGAGTGEETRTEIAVKQFSRDSMLGKDDFLAELTIIHRLRHKHLVRLVGWCYERRKLLLVYDFMPNGSLEKHLYSGDDQKVLNWRSRCKILEGVASALHYIHNEYDQKVLHRDLKSSNILLDSDCNARLGDFGLARALDPERNSYADIRLAGVPGTVGYVAPECFHTGRATPESDVFGFGAVVLEVVCGRNPGASVQIGEHFYNLIDCVWLLHRDGNIEKAVDERLKNDIVVEEVKRLLLLGLACSHPIAGERPSTQAIVQIISGMSPAPYVPPFRPVFIWPSMETTAGTTTTTTGTSLSSSTISSSVPSGFISRGRDSL